MVVGQFAQEAECVIIGAGPAGCSAASRAAELGLQTVLVDGAPPCETTRLAAGVEVLTGSARFEDARQVAIDGGTQGRLHFKRAIVTTGLEVAPPPSEWPESGAITTWQSGDDAPSAGTVLVSGDDALALEAATYCAARGCAVTLVSASGQLVGEADKAVLEPALGNLMQTLQDLHLGGGITAIRESTDGLEVSVQGIAEPRVVVRVILTARRAATAALALEKARVECDDRGFVRIDECCRTSNPRVLAAGAVTGADPEAGLARYQGRVAAEVAAGRESALDARVWPRVVATDPPVAWCGLTESQARATGVAHRVREARRGDPPTMLARLIVDDESAVVLGVGLAGPGAPDAIAQGVLAVEMGAVAEDLAALVHTAGSLGELLAEAARSASSD
jgi:dihydrolipoamide dehydrogenase